MMPRQGTVVADRYRLERKVGGGRVSAMWLVQDQVTDASCAIKLLHRSMNDHPEALARFSLEDRLSRELTGDYFPERVGSGSWHSLRYIAWRWYEGECLRSLFDRNPKQDVQTVYSIVQETCQALTLVHGAGYTHGDLKPENLFFADRSGDSSRQLKLLGFGVASRVARPLLGSQARRTPGQIVGTPLYLSPDLILGRVPRGGQADLWALAVIVYEALTGRAPFLGTDLSEVLEAILERRAARPTTITNNLPATFDVWWTQALEQQFSTPSDFSTSLARALAPALRSSRTQRSASLPDRISPVGQGLAWRSEAAPPRTPEATPRAAEASSFAASFAPEPASARARARAPATDLAAVAAVAAPERRTSPGGLTAFGGATAPALRSALLAASQGGAAAPSAPPTGLTGTAAAGGSAAAAGASATAPVASAATSGSAASGGTSSSSPGLARSVSKAEASKAEASNAEAFGAALSAAALSKTDLSRSAPGKAAPSRAALSQAALSTKATSTLELSNTVLSNTAANTVPSNLDASNTAPSTAASSPAAASLAATSAPAGASPALTAAVANPAPKSGLGGTPGATAAGLGSSPLASRSSGTAAPALTAGVTAPGLGTGPDAQALSAAARTKADSTPPGRSRREPPRPDSSAPRAQARPQPHSAEASDPAAPERAPAPNITSTTVAGIGPAALSLLRNREKATAAAATSPAPAAEASRLVSAATPNDAGRETLPADQFSPLPSPLRDLGVGTRKTLVGIIPPSLPAPAAPVAAPMAHAVAPAPAAPVSPAQTLAIAGTPCRTIEVSGDDEAIDSVVPLRRLGNATVPFARPRAASWSGPTDAEDGLGDEGYLPQAPQSWRNRTSNTLRVVLTDRDHRPHLVAALLVCSAAALVIFALGRSPVSGTGMLGQTTGSLSGREGTASVSTPQPGSPGSSRPSAVAGASAAAPGVPSESPSSPGAESAESASGDAPAAVPALQGEELAPGLVVPPRATTPASLPAADPAQARPLPGAAPSQVRPPSPLPPAPSPARAEPGRVGPAPLGGPASGASPASVPPPPAPPSSTPPRAIPPRKPGTESPSPRPANPDFDFGI